MRYFLILLTVALMSCVSEVTLAQTSTGQPDFSQTSNYLLLNGYEEDYETAKAEWESIKDDPNISKAQKDRVSSQMYSAREGLAGLCSREELGLACLSIALAERGNITGYIYAERACMVAEDRGCILQAIMDAEGEGRRKSPTLAENILKSNCTPDRLEVCRAYASLLESDQGHPADLPKARETYKSFCLQMNDLESCKSAFDLLNAGNPKPEAYLENRLEISRKACSLDPENSLACRHAKDAAELLPLLIDYDSCLASSASDDCGTVAVVLEQYEPRNPNFEQRIMRLRTYSCGNRLSDESCRYLMTADFTPEHLKDYEGSAVAALQSVCLGSHEKMRQLFVAEACQWSVNQGLAKKTERGLLEARPYAERLCALAHQSCDLWAAYLIGGHGEPQDMMRGSAMMLKACEASNVGACLEVAKMLAAGNVGERNLEGAKTLLNNLCQMGEAKACDLLTEFSQIQ